MVEQSFVFRQSQVKGKKYLQVWEKLPEGKYRYVGTIGDASLAARMLVKVRELEKLTNSYEEKLTNLQKENEALLTKLKAGLKI